MIDMRQTGKRLKKQCDERGITVREIQGRLHIGSFQSIYAWFCGKTLPSLDNFYALARLLGVSMESLIVEKRAAAVYDYAWRGFSFNLFWELSRRASIKRYAVYKEKLRFCRV